MKPILFAANATTFTTNGLGQLDPTKCVVVEERNGQYELQCVVPVDSVHFSDIANNMILAVVPGDGMTTQAFRIYAITEPMNGLVTINARHISYDLSYNTVMPFTAGSCPAALDGLETNAVETNLFTMWTDKTKVANFDVKQPTSFRACLGGQQGSILDTYGGEFQWDNWTVKLWNQRGSDTKVTLRYGKNITDITQEQNLENVVTGIVPFWASEDTIVTLPEKSVDSTYASQYPYKRTVPVDFSSNWEDAPTAAQLRSRAQSYITANDIGVPKVSIQVSFIALWQTEEYKNVAPLERVRLCDTVGVEFEKYGISTRAKVVRTEWDCLTERYLSIDLGEARANLANTIVDIDDNQAQEIIEAKSFLQKAIDNATDMITGNNGGHIKLQIDESGEPYELLIMDTPDKDTAVKLWRWNLSGLGYSSNGYNGPYGTAITIDGQIVADYVATGTMNAARIGGGFLQSIESANDPNLVFDLSHGSFTMRNGTMKIGYVETYPVGGTKKRYNFDLASNGALGLGWDTTNHRHKFNVSSSGAITAYDGNIKAGYVQNSGGADRYNFDVDSDGKLGVGWDSTNHRHRLSFDGSALKIYGDGEFSGAVKGGTIGIGGNNYDQFTVNASGSCTIKAGSFQLYEDASAEGGYRFKVDTDGYMKATGATMKSATLNSCTLTGDDANITINDGSTQMVKIDKTGISGGFLTVMDGTGNVYGRFSGGVDGSSEIRVSAQSRFRTMGDCKVDGNMTILQTLNVNAVNASSCSLVASDQRLKKDIKRIVIDKAKAFIMALVPKSFRYKKNDNLVHHGFIAQEVERVAGWDVVSESENGFKGVRYEEIIADLVAVVQDQERRIAALEGSKK